MCMMGLIKDIFTKNLKNKIAASLILPDMKELKKHMDYNEYGGAPLMGIAKPVFKAHGSSKARTFYNALKITYRFVEGNVIGQISDAIAAQAAASEPAGDA